MTLARLVSQTEGSDPTHRHRDPWMMAAWALSVPDIEAAPPLMAILRGQTGVRAGGCVTKDHGESQVSMRMLRHACMRHQKFGQEADKI